MAGAGGEAPAPTRRRWRWWHVALAVGAVLVMAAVFVWWRATRPPKPVSVNDVVNRFRSASSTPPPTGLPRAPASGVYVYATKGSERISAGITHDYPARTTVTITRTGCGLQVRWDALSGRWSQAQLCPSADGWRLVHYTDVHTFLYRRDVHDYSCDPPQPTAGDWSEVCRGAGSVLTSTARRLGTGQRTIDGRARKVTHLRIEQHATGSSVSRGSVDVWVLPDGLPAHLEITDHGAQTVLGSKISYDETATFDLTSLTPRR